MDVKIGDIYTVCDVFIDDEGDAMVCIAENCNGVHFYYLQRKFELVESFSDLLKKAKIIRRLGDKVLNI